MNNNYQLIPYYSMNCRLYPNKTQAEHIDALLLAADGLCYTSRVEPSQILVDGDNPHTLRINLKNLTPIRIRGWYKNIRFGSNQEYDFRDYIRNCPDDSIKIIIKREGNSKHWEKNEYYITFKLHNVWKPIHAITEPQN